LTPSDGGAFIVGGSAVRPDLPIPEVRPQTGTGDTRRLFIPTRRSHWRGLSGSDAAAEWLRDHDPLYFSRRVTSSVASAG
jgi:hypothetical protein